MSGEVVHRLGAVAGAVLVIGVLVSWVRKERRERQARQRMVRLLELTALVEAAGARKEVWAPVRRWLPEVVVAVAGWVLVGGGAGAVLGVLAAVGLWRWRRTKGQVPRSAADEAEAARQLPLAADLLAACVAAGAGPVIAAQAVGEALGGPVGDALSRGAAEVRLGGEPGAAWRGLAQVPGAGALARLLERADVSGLPAADPVARIASDARAERGRTATAEARRAAVLVTAPVGLCFLPAFVVLGIVPVVIGLAGGALGGALRGGG